MSQENPSQIAGPGSRFTLDGRTVEAGRSIEWIKMGWRLFVKNPGTWIGLVVVGGIILILLGAIPMLGHLAAHFFLVIFVGGLLLGCKSLSEGGGLRIEHLFAGCKQNTGNLVMVSVYYLVGIVIIFGVVFVIGGGSMLSGAAIGQLAGAGVIASGIVLALLVGLALYVPLAMGIWFAPALVVFRNVAPLDALMASFRACLKNMGPFLLYGVVVLILLVLAAIPAALGLLVLLPVLMGSLYASYRDIFE